MIIFHIGSFYLSWSLYEKLVVNIIGNFIKKKSYKIQLTTMQKHLPCSIFSFLYQHVCFCVLCVFV